MSSPQSSAVFAIVTDDFTDPVGFATAGAVSSISVGNGASYEAVAGKPTTFRDPGQAGTFFGMGNLNTH